MASHCLMCGCTEDHACTTPAGPCHWVAVAPHLGLGVCSHCVAPRLDAAVRPEVERFALAMEARLAANDHKSGWRGLSFSHLFSRAIDELDEVARAHLDCNTANTAAEAADAANFCMMIFDNAIHAQGATHEQQKTN